ncbi:hypothetical protein [Paenibacillus xylaniclasticus]|uniref:hypothetical protein n=1 Tax=Paenibacillus xylaniclasticus TaxID=588083 RepID=UPI000FD86F64|nr:MULTISPECIES: hypothetical protein [Paenibacillus]GFN30955.1 hypothetical protein PCURB6_12150 [Paenibacillus curdlanolyticus]
MIFGASLGPYVKKALGDKAFQTNVNKIIELLPQSPDVSNMDAVVLGPRDLQGVVGRTLEQAVNNKNADVAVLYLYMKDHEADLLGDNVTKLQVGKVTPEGIGEAIASIKSMSDIGSDARVIESADARTHEEQEVEPVPAVPADPTITQEIEEAVEEAAASVLEEEQTYVQVVPEPIEEPISEYEEPSEAMKTIEQRLAEMGQFADFGLLKQSLQKDAVVGELMAQNSQYAGVVNLLETLDAQIYHIFKDTTLTAEERFDRIKQLGVERAAYEGLGNGIIVDKFSSIMRAVIKSAEDTVDNRIESIRQSLGAVTSTRLEYQDHARLQTLIETRLSIQMDLMALSKEIIEVYMAMDQSVTEMVDGMKESGTRPFDNDYVNEIMKPAAGLFVPQNIADVTNRLIGDLQSNRVALSIMENKIKSVVNLVFRLCEEDATIIDYQQKLIQLLRSQRVEDVVIVDNVIKNALRLFVGPADTGRTATAVTWAGILARRQNTLLLDLTGSSKMKQYGMETVELDRFMADRIERPLLAVEGTLQPDSERFDEVLYELKTRIHYYAHICLILDASQTELLDRLASSALAVHFITDCTPRGNALVKSAIAAFKEENVARKVILIDPPVEPIRIMRDLAVDPLRTKLIVIPYLKHIRACSLNGYKPFDSSEVMEVFEEAFR